MDVIKIFNVDELYSKGFTISDSDFLDKLIILLRQKKMADIFNLLNTRKDNVINVNDIEYEGMTDLLIEAIVNKDTTYIMRALEKGFDVDKGSFNYIQRILNTNDKIFIITLLRRLNEEMPEVLLKLLNQLDEATGGNILHKLIKETADVEMIDLMAFYGANLNEKDKLGNTPLQLLFFNIEYLKKVLTKDFARMLLDREANFDIDSGDGHTLKSHVLSLAKYDTYFTKNRAYEYLKSNLID